MSRTTLVIRAPMRATRRRPRSGHQWPAWPGNAMNGSLVTPRLEVDRLVRQVLLVALRGHRVARPRPRRDVGEVVVVAQGLALLGLVLGAEVAATALPSLQCVTA